MARAEAAWLACSCTALAASIANLGFGPRRAPWTGRDLFRLLGASLLSVATVALVLAWQVWGLVSNFQFFVILGGFAGLVPGLVHLPNGPSAASAPAGRRRFVCVFMPVLAFGLWAWEAAVALRSETRSAGWLQVAVQLFVVLLSTPIAMLCVGRRNAPSIYVHDATWCVVTAWAVVLLDSVCHALSAQRKDLHFLLWSATLHLDGLVIIWNAFLLVRRLKALTSHTFCGVKRSRYLLGLMTVGYYFSSYFDFTVHAMIGDEDEWLTMPVYLTLSVSFGATYIFYTGSIAVFLVRSALVLRREASRLQGAPRAEALWASKVLCCEVLGCMTGVVTTMLWSAIVFYRCAKWVGDVRPSHKKWFKIIYIFGHRLEILSIIVSVALISGLLWQPRLPAAKNFKKPSQLCHTNPCIAHDLQDEDAQTEWSAKVEELAGRGFSLCHLLDFWESLTQGAVMSSFDPRRSTTNDVVRQAIIPLSRNTGASSYGGRALATVWSQGHAVQAKRMVTHNWSNLFLHLVAGIVADALGEDYYAGVAANLLRGDEGLEEIRLAVEAKGAAGEAYWVCAISVNQHAGICGGFGPMPEPGTEQFAEWDANRKDTVTQEDFPVCSCGERKVFNDDPAGCEMNKFDAMMRLLSRRVPSFSHLVVVDANFVLFGRAWCIAEIVESSFLGSPQRIMLHSHEMLDLHYHRLASVDVADCRASREEDKEMILSRISDRDAFNRQLQWAIFGTEGLFSKWLDGRERAQVIGRIVARAQGSCSPDTSDTLSDVGYDVSASSSDWSDEGAPPSNQV